MKPEQPELAWARLASGTPTVEFRVTGSLANSCAGSTQAPGVATAPSKAAGRRVGPQAGQAPSTRHSSAAGYGLTDPNRLGPTGE